MKIGISIPEPLRPPTKSPEDLFAWVKRVDTGPFSTLSILDRIVFSNYEALITLAAAAALSSRVRLMTEVLLAPLRNTTILAKEIATLDVLSKGRITLGLGVGTREDDFIATESSLRRRGKHIEEQITRMRSIWTGHALQPGMGPIGPTPVQSNGPKILLGGFAPQVIKRVGHYADGFITALNDMEQINQIFRAVERSWQEAGRSGKPHLVAQIDIALETHSIGQGRKDLRAYYAVTPPYDEYKSATLLTTTGQLRETIQALDQIGADEVIFFTWSTEPDQIDRIADLTG